MFLKYFSFRYFFISFAIGVLYIYLSDDYKKVIVVYPNPNNVDENTYVDKSDNCFNYELNPETCPTDKKNYVNINVNY